MGFSAGAMTTLNAGLAPAAADRPAFIAPIYPPITAREVPADAPPMFVALALDDELFGRQGFGLVEAWHGAKRPVEFHAYESGGHGFGLGNLAWLMAVLIGTGIAALGGRLPGHQARCRDEPGACDQSPQLHSTRDRRRHCHQWLAELRFATRLRTAGRHAVGSTIRGIEEKALRIPPR